MSPVVPPLSKRLKRFLRYVLVRVALSLVSLLPLAWASGLGARFGALAYALAGRERRKALASLERAGLPAGLACGCLEHLGRGVFELACIAQIDARFD